MELWRAKRAHKHQAPQCSNRLHRITINAKLPPMKSFNMPENRKSLKDLAVALKPVSPGSYSKHLSVVFKLIKLGSLAKKCL